jgi:hypothetical protein
MVNDCSARILQYDATGCNVRFREGRTTGSGRELASEQFRIAVIATRARGQEPSFEQCAQNLPKADFAASESRRPRARALMAGL